MDKKSVKIDIEQVLSEFKIWISGVQYNDRVKFLADNFSHQEFEDAKKMQTEIRCEKIKETICYNCFYNNNGCCAKGIDRRTISSTCRYNKPKPNINNLYKSVDD